MIKYLTFIVIILTLFLSGVFLFQHNTLSSLEPEWLTFSGLNTEYSIKYPETWKVIENDLGDGMVNFSITNNSGYELKRFSQSAPARICIFNDTDIVSLKNEIDTSMPGYYDEAKVELGEYTQFGNYRRSIYEDRVTICDGWRETSFEYMLPSSPDQAIISEMDEMVLSFNWVGTVRN